MSVENVLRTIKEENVKYVDFRFTDPRGKEHHVSVPAETACEDGYLTGGKMFDGSSIAGWKEINNSDMLLMPDFNTACIDPFYNDLTLYLRCDILEPDTKQPYNRDPRSIAKRAEQYLKETGIADVAYFGPELEFFVFDSVRWHNDYSGCSYDIESAEAVWSSNKAYESGNIGHRPGIKGGYFPVPPVDSLQDIRSAMCEALAEMGVVAEVHHHEVGTAGQCEIGTRYAAMVERGDLSQIQKYVVLNVANNYGKTATFMPKPIVGDNGTGMHVHQTLSKDGENLFAGDQYADLTETALYYIGGILKHARAINAFSNAATNSYKRLVPGFEAPVMLAYSARNRSAAIRIPHVVNPKSRRIEVRFPDAAGNPYLTFVAMLMAGLDGIQNRINPGDPTDKDLYELSPAEEKAIPKVAASLDEAVAALDADRDFLKAGNVLDDDAIDGYIELKMEEISRLRQATHPVEFDMYYSL
ncbi:MAG: type I glutamate--ammonia ligase [Chromatiales bacterium]|nr:type I glutamate--ammonia ligase [Chromatiales bacterium]